MIKLIKLTKEGWGVGPTDTKAHLYCDEGYTTLRRLCHRGRVKFAEIVEPGDTEKCRLCLNIRGLIPTRGRKYGARK